MGNHSEEPKHRGVVFYLVNTDSNLCNECNVGCVLYRVAAKAKIDLEKLQPEVKEVKPMAPRKMHKLGLNYLQKQSKCLEKSVGVIAGPQTVEIVRTYIQARQFGGGVDWNATFDNVENKEMGPLDLVFLSFLSKNAGSEEVKKRSNDILTRKRSI